MPTVIHRRPEAARQRLARIFYFYMGYFPRPAPYRLRWQARPDERPSPQVVNPHKEF